MAEAAIVSIEVYKNTLLTAGIDFYNIEAEAGGCEVRYHETKIIPGIVSHPLSSQEGIKCLFCVLIIQVEDLPLLLQGLLLLKERFLKGDQNSGRYEVFPSTGYKST